MHSHQIALTTPFEADVPVGAGQDAAEMIGAILAALRRRGIFGRPTPRAEGMSLRFRITVDDALEASIPTDRIAASLLESYPELRTARDEVHDRLEQLEWQRRARRHTA